MSFLCRWSLSRQSGYHWHGPSSCKSVKCILLSIVFAHHTSSPESTISSRMIWMTSLSGNSMESPHSSVLKVGMPILNSSHLLICVLTQRSRGKLTWAGPAGSTSQTCTKTGHVNGIQPNPGKDHLQRKLIMDSNWIILLLFYMYDIVI